MVQFNIQNKPGRLTRIKNGINNRLRNHLPAVSDPKLNSNYYKFYSNYGWIFQSANRTIGDYQLYKHAENNVYVYRSIQVISDTLLINGFSINNPDDLKVDFERTNYLTNLFNNPEGWSSEITYAMFHKQYITSFELTGDAFIEVNYEKFDYGDDDPYNVISGFQYIPPQLLRWFPDTEQWGYRSKPSIRYEPEELIHIYEPGVDLRDIKYGVSKLEKIRLPILMMYLGLEHNQKILENDGIDPKAILSFDKDISDESFEKEILRLAALTEERRKGGTLAVKGATFQSAATSNSEMDFISLLELCRDMILTCYGVQPGKAGIRETANLGTGSGESQDKDFKDMMNAKARLIEGAFNKKLGHNGFQELFQFNEMDIEDKLKRTQIEMNKLNSGVVTVNEVRKDYGLEPVPWGDVPNTLSNDLNSNELVNEDNVSVFKRFKNNVLNSGLLSEWSNGDEWDW